MVRVQISLSLDKAVPASVSKMISESDYLPRGAKWVKDLLQFSGSAADVLSVTFHELKRGGGEFIIGFRSVAA